MPKSHRKKDHETQYIYAELANNRLEAASKRAGVELNGKTQYCFRHTWNTFYIGKLPEVARLLLMGHYRNRPEYTHLTPIQSLERVLTFFLPYIFLLFWDYVTSFITTNSNDKTG